MTSHEVSAAAKGYLLKYGWQRDSYGDEGFPTCATAPKDTPEPSPSVTRVFA